MTLLEPGFAVAPDTPARVGRLRPTADPRIDSAVDAALATVGWECVELELPEWEAATASGGLLLVAEAWATDGALVGRAEDRIGADVVARLRIGQGVDAATMDTARAAQSAWRQRLGELFGQLDLLAMPTLTVFPPPLGQGEELLMARCTLPVNVAGVPALSLPVPSTGPLPASLQLVGPHHSEERLLAAGLQVEAALS
jgi:Asp-tRNA(Asn)/Glu-tRNA(Gln) amidotransferase A subunit family amidase